MSVLITDLPTKLVNNDAALVSRWSSVHQPIIFKGRRNDRMVVQVQLLSGQFRVLLSSAPPAELTIGSKAWLKSGATNSAVTITGISGNQLTVTGSVAPYSIGGHINFTELLANYYISINVYAVSTSGSYVRVGTHELRPNPDGNFTFDAHGYLKSYASLRDEFTYNAINKKQVKQGSKFNFGITENWVGSENVEQPISASSAFYWANGIKQLQERYNFNLGAHVLFRTIDTAKFMSDFKKPTYFPGLPFSLSFIYSDKVAGHQLERVEDDFNAPTVQNLDAAQGEAVNRLMLSGAYAPNIKEIDVWLNDTGVKPIRYVLPGYVGGGYVAPVPPIKPVKGP